MYNTGMRILITPFIKQPRIDTSFYLTFHIASLLKMENHVVAISANKENHFHHVSLYPCANAKPPFSLQPLTKRSYEEWMYANGAASKKYLEEDDQIIEKTIAEFQPDLIITMDRIAAIVSAKNHHIPCWGIVHSDMYKNTAFDPNCLHDLNLFLAQNGLEQVFHLNELYQKCSMRFGFGPIEVQPFSTKDQITRIGINSLTPPHIIKTNRVCIFLPEVKKKPSQLKKIITDAFEGAPYSVYAWFPGCRPEKSVNMRFLSVPRADLLPGSIACIHDGNDYYTNQCLARGIRQLIIATHDYIRNSNALSATRNRFGLAMYEDELSMKKLYEQYRLLLSDDKYYYHTQAMKNITEHSGDLSMLLEYLKEV